MRELTRTELEEIASAAISAKLVSPERRSLLFRGLPNDFVDNLPIHSRARDQVISDIYELGKVPELTGLDRPPLVIWLENAISLAPLSPASEVFMKYRNAVTIDINLVSTGGIFQELRSRRELIQISYELLVRPTRSYRSSIAGPFFLHPIWYKERRDRKSQLLNYDDALAKFVNEFCQGRNHDIRLIFTFSPRYRAKIDTYIAPEERVRFQDDLLKAIDDLWGVNGEKGPDICCVHPGFVHIQTIFDSAVIITYRPSQMIPTSSGLVSYSPDVIKRERALFDTVFDNCSKGQEDELKTLKQKVRELW